MSENQNKEVFAEISEQLNKAVGQGKAAKDIQECMLPALKFQISFLPLTKTDRTRNATTA